MKPLTGISAQSDTATNILFQAAGFVFLGLFAFPLYPMHLANALLMLFCALTLTIFVIRPFKPGKILLHHLIFVLPFIPYLVEFVVTGFHPVVRFEFEKKLFFFTAVIFVPLFIRGTGFTAFRNAMLVFALSVIALVFYGMGVLLVKGIPFDAQSYANGSFALRHAFEQTVRIHSTYMAAFALAAAVFFFVMPWKYRRMARAAAFFLILFTLYMAVRIAFVAVVLLGVYTVLRYRTGTGRKIILMLVLLLVMTAIAFVVPSLRSRLSEFAGFNTTTVVHTNTISQRTAITACAWQLFTDNILTGKGSRCAQSCLNKCYTHSNWPEGAAQQFNPHNQFLSFGISYGAGGLLLFAVCLFLIFYRSRSTPAGPYFIIIVLMFFMTESMLERSMGVYFFGLFALLFYNSMNGTYMPIKRG